MGGTIIESTDGHSLGGSSVIEVLWEHWGGMGSYVILGVEARERASWMAAPMLEGLALFCPAML
jgi:hypothetical protein